MGSPNWNFYRHQLELADDTPFYLGSLGGEERDGGLGHFPGNPTLIVCLPTSGSVHAQCMGLQELFTRFTTGQYTDEDPAVMGNFIRSIMILGFPADNLRVTDSTEEVHDGYGAVEFPILKRVEDINAHPFLIWLRSETPTHSEYAAAVEGEEEPAYWRDYDASINDGFEMFLVDCFGYPVGRWSGATPLETLVPHIEEAFEAFR
ncbi:hypothetical protein BDZ88DRAFT_436895 [Geranomyces variabilis]|nr:hypothetical protein BDZ88DRAFT_436895 [Geranomyces variabilis]KAJ3142118.1 hypothetical protein HDU90_004391 [Geranomyces variabilis]